MNTNPDFSACPQSHVPIQETKPANAHQTPVSQKKTKPQIIDRTHVSQNQTEAALTLAQRLAPVPLWFRQNKRDLPWRHTCDPYRIWISEIMLQQTRVAAALDYYHRFLEHLPDVAALASVEDDELMRLWAGLGYYSRAKNLRRSAQIIQSDFEGHFPAAYNDLLKLPGVGPYTAGAIASIAFSQPVACVDGNVLRLLSRLLADTRDISLPSLKPDVQNRLNHVLSRLPSEDISPMNQGLMELGATICVPKGQPRCDLCPLAPHCLGLAYGLHTTLPYKSPPKKRRREELTVLLLYRDGQVALEKRPPKGLLAGLWQYPNLPGRQTPAQITKAMRQWHLEPLRILSAGRKTHIFTHIQWDMHFYHITVADTIRFPPNLFWTDAARQPLDFPLPSAFLPPSQSRAQQPQSFP